LSAFDADEAFGHWLAGFVDGEGCFLVRHRSNHGLEHMVYCMFCIKLRADDREIIEEIRRWLGFGRIAAIRPRMTGDGIICRQPQIDFSVRPKADCLRLVDIFDRYPLRAKKARDYALWREAVTVWAGIPSNGAGGGPHLPAWARMAEICAALERVRKYDGPEAHLSAPPESPQLRLAS
jgi:hypothetical protein